MAYCRFSEDSDLYFVGVQDGYQCINCKLMPSEYASWHGKTRTDVFKHFMDHEDCGDMVPLSALRRITEELANIPQEHWDNEFNALMRKLATPNDILKEFLQENHAARVKRIGEFINEFADAIADLDNLNWPEE